MKAWTAAALVISLAACKTEEKAVPAELLVEPVLLDFGSIGLGGSSTLEFTVSNLGGSAAGILSVTLTEGDADVWSIDRNGVDTVLGGETATLFVTFAPEDTELYNGQLQLRTDVEAQASFTIGLKGSGGLSEADEDGDGVSVAQGDCDDGNAEIYPGADELCNGRDDDCNGTVPDNETDDDSDGFRLCDDDCDDTDINVYPGAVEICDKKDTDCDGINADNEDRDGDGRTICEGDCDDTEGSVSPDLPELCDDELDNDCDGITDNIDADGDGHSLCGSAPDCDDTDGGIYPIVVSESGSSDGDGTEADPYDSIETGLASLDGSCNTLYLLPGTYEFGTTWSGGELLIEGTTNAGNVILQAPKDDRHLAITGGEVTLQDVTLTGGSASEDGGSISVANAELTLSGTVHQGNNSANDGGAVAVSSGTLTLRRGCVFEGNTAEDDGGALLLDASNFVDTAGTEYLGNTGKKGGAVYVVGGSATIADATFRSNVGTVEGGAIAATGSPSNFSIARSHFTLNDAVADGGAVVLRDFSVPSGLFRNNTLQDNAAGAGGGGLAIVGAAGSIGVHNNTFTGNVAVAEGGAIVVRLTLDGAGVEVLANVMHSNDGESALFVSPGITSLVQYNTGFGTNSGIHFAGEIGDGSGAGVDPTNAVRNPTLTAFSSDGNPDNDDLTLGGGSPEIDDGPPVLAFDDNDGSQNDRGYTGGPGAE